MKMNRIWRDKVMLTQEKKLEAINIYMKGGRSLRSVAKQYGVHHSTIEKWLHNYQLFGAEGLKRPEQNRQYTEEEKQEAVVCFFAEAETLYNVCKKYKIRSISLLQNWIQKYEQEFINSGNADEKDQEN